MIKSKENSQTKAQGVRYYHKLHFLDKKVLLSLCLCLDVFSFSVFKYRICFCLFLGATAVVDLQAMWYPTVRRTLVCLSKLYNSIGVSA